MKYGWVKQYKKGGVEVFSDQQRGIIRAAQHKYSEDFVPFFRDLAQELGPDTEVGSQIYQVFEASRAVVRLFGALLGANGRPAVDREITALFDNMDFIKKSIEKFNVWRAKDSVFDGIVSRVERKSGSNLDRLSSHNGVILKNLENLALPKEGTAEWLKRVAPGAYSVGAGVASGALTAALGPFSGIAGMVGGGIAGIAKDIKEKRIAKKKMRLAEALTTAKEFSAESILSKYGMLRERGRDLRGSIKDSYLGGVSGGIEETRESAPLKSKSPRISGQSVRSGVSVNTSLFEFFNKDAFRAKWTKDVYRALTSGGKGGDVGKSSGLLSSLVAGGAGAGMAAKVGGAAGVGAMLGKGLLGGAMWASIASGIIDAVRSAFDASKIFGKKPGEKVIFSERATSAMAGFVAGTSKGWADQGTSFVEKVKDTLILTVRNSLIGAKFAGLPGAIIGAIMGFVGAALGRDAIAKAGDTFTKWSTKQLVGYEPGKDLEAHRVTEIVAARRAAGDLTTPVATILEQERAKSGVTDNIQAMQARQAARTTEKNNEVSQLLKEMNNNLKSDKKSAVGIERQAQADMFSTGDPMIENLNSGTLMVEG